MDDVMELGKRLYERAIAKDPDEALRMAMEATETEEKRFYTFIADMTLQRRVCREFQERLTQKEGKGEARNMKTAEEAWTEFKKHYLPVEMIIQQTAGTMALSGFTLSEEDEYRIREAYDHPEKIEAIVAELVQKHKKDPEVGNG